MNKNTLALGAAGVVLLVILIAWWLVPSSSSSDTPAVENPRGSEISSFEECKAAGYPVMESFPEQCAVPDGGTFTRDISGEE